MLTDAKNGQHIGTNERLLIIWLKMQKAIKLDISSLEK
jgi:hypothetical protein